MLMKYIFTALAALTAVAVSNPSQAQQVLKVGVNPGAAPVSFHDTKSNTFRGMAVELIAAIGKDAGFEVQYLPIPLRDLIPALNSNKIDIIAANMRVTPERKALVDFSESYHKGGDALIVAKTDTKEYKTIVDLKGMIIGVQKGTAQLTEIQKTGLFPDVKFLDSFADVIREVGAGRVAAGILGATQARYEQHQGNFLDVRVVTSFHPPTAVPGIAYGVRKSDGELLRRINTSLAKLQADGTVKKILASYGL